jgi:hypothetical protein
VAWINVPTSVRFDLRLAIARLGDRQLRLIDIDMNLFINLDEFNETFCRRVLSEFFNGVANWQIHGVFYNYQCRCVDFVVSSPEFDAIPDGQENPVLCGDKWIKKEQA